MAASPRSLSLFRDEASHPRRHCGETWRRRNSGLRRRWPLDCFVVAAVATPELHFRAISSSSISQIGLADVFVVGDLAGRARHHDASGFDDVCLVGEFERELRVLLDDEDADLVFAVDLAEDLEQIA